ncbi:MAG: hypothetical protein AB8F95_16425 [Bacteroidia bacterium]
MDIFAVIILIVVLLFLAAPFYLLSKINRLRGDHEELNDKFDQLLKSHKAILKREYERETKQTLSKPISRPSRPESPTIYSPEPKPQEVSPIPEPEPIAPPEIITPKESAPVPKPIEKEAEPVITLGQVSAPARAGARREMYADTAKTKKPQTSAPTPKQAPSAPTPPAWLKALGDNWLGVAGAAVLVLGLVFLGVYAASSFGPFPRFLMLIGVGGLLVGGGFLLRKKPLFKPATGYLRASGGAVWLFACLGAGGLPGLQFIDDPLLALGTLLVGVAVNLYLGFFGKTQSFSALHVILSLLAIGAAQHFAAPSGVVLFGAGVLVSAYGIALSFRNRWPWHLLALVVAYALFHLNWLLYASDFFNTELNFLQQALGGGGTGLIAVLAALTHYQKRYSGSKMGLPGIIHLLNWMLALLSIVPHSLGGKIAPYALTAGGLGLMFLARYARKLQIRWLFTTDTLVGLLMLCAAAISLARLGASPFVVLLILVLVLVAAGFLFYTEKETALQQVVQAGFALIGLGGLIVGVINIEDNNTAAILLTLAPVIGLAWLGWSKSIERPDAKFNDFEPGLRLLSLIFLALLLPLGLLYGKSVGIFILVLSTTGIGLSLLSHFFKDKSLSYANLIAMLMSALMAIIMLYQRNGTGEIWYLAGLALWPLSAALLHPDRTNTSGFGISSTLAGFAIGLIGFWFVDEWWSMWILALPAIVMRFVAFRKSWNGLLSGVGVLMVCIALLGMYFVLGIPEKLSSIEHILAMIPVLALAGTELFCSTKSAKLPYPSWLGIYLTTGAIMLASTLILRPVSGLLPGILWLALAPISVTLARSFELNSKALIPHILRAAAILLFAFLVRHLTVHLGSSAYLAGIPIRAMIGILGVAVMAYVLVFERNTNWDRFKIWKYGQPLLLEIGFILLVITLAFEMKVPYWQPIVWTILGIMSLVIGSNWKAGSRLRLYGLLCSWAASFQIAFVASTSVLPSSSMTETPWFTALISIALLIGFVVMGYRMLNIGEVRFPFQISWLGSILGKVQKRPLPWLILPVAFGAAIFFYFAFEKSQLTLLWMTEALVLFALAIFLREPYFRYISLAIVAICMIRLPLFDLTSASLLGRALSFIGVGSMLMAMDLIYRKFSPRITDAPEEADPFEENETS